MINKFLAAMFVGLQTILAGARGRVATSRGANFIEYALLAAVAVVLFLLFRTQITAVAENIFSKVTGNVNSVI